MPHAGPLVTSDLTTPASSRSTPTTSRLSALLVGGVVGAVAAVAARLPSRAVLGLVVAVTLLAAAAALASPLVERILLAVVLVDLPLQLDVNLFYDDDVGALGGYGGLGVSVTTFALAALYASRSCRRGPALRDGLRPLVWLPFALYTAVTAASTLVASDRALAGYWVALLVEGLLLYLYLLWTVTTVQDVRYVLTLLLVGLALAAVHMMFQSFAGTRALVPSTSGAEGVVSPRATGMFGSPNSAGLYLSTLLPLAAAVVMARGPRWLSRTAAVAGVLGSGALLVTYSRGSWIGSTLALVVVVAFGVRCGLLTLRRAVAWTLSAIAVAAPFAGLVTTRLLGDDGDAAESRLPLLRIAWRMFTDRPVLGVGANNYVTALPDQITPEFTREWSYVVHNDYLLVLAQTGLLGATAYAAFLITTLLTAVGGLAVRDALLRAVALGALGALTGRLVVMLVESSTTRMSWHTLLVVAALAACAHRALEDDRSRRMARLPDGNSA